VELLGLRVVPTSKSTTIIAAVEEEVDRIRLGVSRRRIAQPIVFLRNTTAIRKLAISQTPISVSLPLYTMG